MFRWKISVFSTKMSGTYNLVEDKKLSKSHRALTDLSE